MSSKRLALIAVIIWFCSLALPAHLFTSNHPPLFGYQMLLGGWMAPLVLNFAWYANLFFWYAILRLNFGKAPVISSILALLLSFDTFFFVVGIVPLSQPIRGYGWGTIFWFLSIFLLLMAVGAKRQEQKKSLNLPRGCNWLGWLGFLLFTATAYFSIRDRNPAELGIAFKFGTVCRLPAPIINHPMQNFSGSLEIIVMKDNKEAVSLDTIRELLEWGIPVVRHANIDYSIDSNKYEKGLLSSVPAVGSSTAVLKENYTETMINAKLIEVSTNRIVVDQTWPRRDGVYTDSYCPDFSSDNPRQLIMQGLGLSKIKTISTSQKKILQTDNRIIEGIVMGHTMGGDTRQMRIDKWEKLYPDGQSDFPDHENFNTNCPNEVGWIHYDNDLPQNIGSVWQFRVKNKSYHLSANLLNATCVDDAIYLYSSCPGNKGYNLRIQKRTFSDFRLLWTESITIPSYSIWSSNPVDMLRIQSLKEKKDNITMVLVHDNSGEIFTVQAPLPQPQ
jgi:hypothetical protein